MTTTTRTSREITTEILSRLDVATEFESLGVKLAGNPRASGMISAYAFGRDDRKPSAWVNIRTGYYGDSGGKDAESYTCSLFDLAVRVGRFSDRKTARKAYAEKAGVKIGREKRDGAGGDKADWRDRIEFQSWSTPGNETLAQLWCAKHKRGVTLESIKAAGGQLAYYPCWIDKKTGEKKRIRNCHQVIALPAYGVWLLDGDPSAWVLWDVSGREFDVTPKDTPPTEPRLLAKMVSIGPTAGTLMGLSSLMLLCDQDRRAAVELIWKVEGPADMLALWSALPPEARETVAVVTQAGGATADVLPHQAKLLAGLPVAVVPDADEAGIVGAEKWCRALRGIAASVMVVELPWPIERSHGRDVRDYLNGVPTHGGDGDDGGSCGGSGEADATDV